MNPPRSLTRAKRKAIECPIKGKVGYRTKRVALLAANRSNLPQARVYRCPRCKRWHLTSQPKQTKAAA